MMTPLSSLAKQRGRRTLGAAALSGALLIGTVGGGVPAGAEEEPPEATEPVAPPTTAAPATTAAPTTAAPTTAAPTTAAPVTAPPVTAPPPTQAPETTQAPGPTPTAPPATQAPTQTTPTLPEATLPPPGAEEPEEDGGGDVGEVVTPPPAPSGDPGDAGGSNTGGGAVVGSSPIRELAPGIWETPVLVGGEAGVQGVSLRETATKVRKEAESVAFSVEEQRSAAKARVIEAETALVQAERAVNNARKDLDSREATSELARKQLSRMSVASYTNLYGENDPDVLALTGQTMRSSVVREYSGTVMVGADENQVSASKGLESAQASVKKLTTAREGAKAALAESRKGLADTEASLAKVVSEASSLTFDDPDVPDETTPALPELPEGALATTTAGGSPEAQQPDAALAALLANDLTVTYPIAGDWNFIDSWGFERAGGARSHKGNDLFSRYGNPVVAVEDGVVRVATNSLGGNTVYLYGRSGNRYYYAHLSAVADGIDGQQVEVGQVVGKIGTSGNAIGTPPHVHFEVKPPGGETSNPYPMLKALALAVTQARAAGATPTVRAQDLPKLPDALGRTLWTTGKVRSDTLRRLGTDDWVTLINRTVLPVEALSLADPLIATAVAQRLGDKVDPESLPKVTGGVVTTAPAPVALPSDAKAPMPSPPTSQAAPTNLGGG